ncbi:hypothetical protein MAHJHV64_08250 [Mycobacterium avium subsp. hominissuis]
MNVPLVSIEVFGPGGGGGVTVTVTVLVCAGGVEMTVVAVGVDPPQPARNNAAPATAAVLPGERRHGAAGQAGRCLFTTFPVTGARASCGLRTT